MDQLLQLGGQNGPPFARGTRSTPVSLMTGMKDNRRAVYRGTEARIGGWQGHSKQEAAHGKADETRHWHHGFQRQPRPATREMVPHLSGVTLTGLHGLQFCGHAACAPKSGSSEPPKRRGAIESF